MFNTDRRSTLQQYHYQAGKDWFASSERDSLKSRIIETTMDQIMASYNEFMSDLMCEQMEAY